MQTQLTKQSDIDLGFAFGEYYEKAKRGQLQSAQRPEYPEIYDKVWNSQKPYQIWYGGRGSAKSWTKVIQLLMKSMRPEYNRTIFARDTQKNVRLSQYQLFQDVAARFPYFRDKFEFSNPTMKVTCKSTGNFLVGGSFEMPDSLRSVADPTDFWAEEPITRQAQIKRESFFDIVGSLRNSYGIPTQYHFTFNPILKETWIYKDFFEQDIFDSEKLFVNYPDNPYCPEALVTFLESLKVLDPKRYKVDALGEWGLAFAGIIYKAFDAVEAEEMPEVEFYGLDFGYNDPCALVAQSIKDVEGEPKKNLYWREDLYEAGHTSTTLINRFEQIGVNKTLPMICDNARPEMIVDIQKAGYNARACTKYKGSVQDGISEVQKYNLKIVKGSTNIFDELANYIWAEKADGTLLDEPDKNCIEHLCDAGRYGLESRRKITVEVSDAEKQLFGSLSLNG